MTTEIRHRWPDRLFHWTMAVSVLVLLFSSLLPIAGLKFDWIPWHWIAGVCLSVLLVFHIVRALLVQGLSSMLPSASDFRDLFGKASANDRPPAKYDIFQKSYHWIVAIVMLGLVASGLPMLIKLDTLFWDRDPGMLSDQQWGYIYVLHGFGTLLLIFLAILHIYFALLPEHKALLVSMLKGKYPQVQSQGSRAEGAMQGESS